MARKRRDSSAPELDKEAEREGMRESREGGECAGRKIFFLSVCTE